MGLIATSKETHHGKWKVVILIENILTDSITMSNLITWESSNMTLRGEIDKGYSNKVMQE